MPAEKPEKTKGRAKGPQPAKPSFAKTIKKAPVKAKAEAAGRASAPAKEASLPAKKPAKAAVKAAAIDPQRKPIVLGSRGSALALTQANMVKGWLEEANPGLQVSIEIIKTVGDVDQDTPLIGFDAMGIFVKQIQAALQDGRIDVAVHSLKDVPEEQPEDLVLAAFPPREDARDVFVSKGVKFQDLPQGARVGTGSPRRILQFRALRPDLKFVAMRGNVDTRLEKLGRGDVEGIVLAAAGLNRLGRADVITHSFSFQECVPAVGQAALALECRADDKATLRAVRKLDDPETAEAVELERQFMKAVGGGCRVPMAAHAYPYGDSFRFMAVIGDAATGKFARIERVLDPEDAEEEVDEIAEDILEMCRAKGLPTPKDS
jgi:hydroxymethylbilane synthase